MMLKTSSRNVNPFFGMLKFTLRKNLGIIIIVTIAALLYCPGHYLTDYEYYYESYANGSVFSIDMIQELLYTVSVAAGILVTLFNFMNFTYMYQKRSSDVFHAFPLTRIELLASRMLAAFIQVLIPVTVAYCAYTAMWAFNPWMSSSFAQILVSYLHTILVMLVCSSFSMIFVVSAGSLFDLGVSFIGANGALLLVAAIINFILEEMLVGYAGNSSHEIMKAVSPLYYSGVGLANLDNVKYYGISGQTVEYIITSIVYCIVFTVIALVLYNFRKAEKGGQAYAFKYIYIICSVLAGVCGGYLVGYMFSEGDFNPIFWIFATIGSILVCTIYGAVTNRGFKNIKKSIIIGGVSALILPIIAVVSVSGCFGFTYRIPSSEKVESAYVSYFSEYIEYEDIDKMQELHKKILKSDALIGRSNLTGEQTRWIYFHYILNDGTTVSRRFHIVQPKAADVLLELYKSDERIETLEKKFEESNPVTVNFGFRTNDEYYYTYITRAEFTQLMEYYKQDLKVADTSYILDEIPYTFDVEWINADNKYSTHYYTLEYSEKFENTYNYIESLDLVNRSKEQEKTEIQKY